MQNPEETVADENLEERKSGNPKDPILSKLFANKYAMEKKIGAGAMGKVYKALDQQSQKNVAIKMILDLKNANDKILERFKREALVMSKLEHKNIVKVYEAGEYEKTPYIAMEYVEGSSLSQQLKSQKKLPIKHSIEIIYQVANAVYHAHAQQIVHRDLKPSNIMIDNNGTPKVMDFGIAKLENSKKKLTKTYANMGTLAYMSPEQVEGNNKDVGAQSDIYALGVILYEVITGNLPYQGTTTEILYKICYEKPIPPTSIKPHIPKELENICLKAMAKKKNKRYQNVKEFGRDLGRYLKGKQSKKAKAARPNKHNQLLIVNGIFLIIIILAFALPGKNNKVKKKKNLSKKQSTRQSTKNLKTVTKQSAKSWKTSVKQSAKSLNQKNLSANTKQSKSKKQNLNKPLINMKEQKNNLVRYPYKLYWSGGFNSTKITLENNILTILTKNARYVGKLQHKKYVGTYQEKRERGTFTLTFNKTYSVGAGHWKNSNAKSWLRLFRSPSKIKKIVHWQDEPLEWQEKKSSQGVYFGQWKNGKKHGYGRDFRHSGEKYTGVFYQGKKHGLGIEVASDSTYFGEFRYGQKLGKGFLSVPKNKYWYVGDYNNTGMTGEGIAFSQNYLYVGSFLSGLKQGDCVCFDINWNISQKLTGLWYQDKRLTGLKKFKDWKKQKLRNRREFAYGFAGGFKLIKVTYYGEIRNGVPQGKGIGRFYYSGNNKLMYFGPWHQGIPKGKGLIVVDAIKPGEKGACIAYVNGPKMQTGFRIQPHTKGSFPGRLAYGKNYVYPQYQAPQTFQILTGIIWKQSNSKGFILQSDGSLYQGGFIRGVLSHGFGTLRSANGKITKGQWDNGKFVK